MHASSSPNPFEPAGRLYGVDLVRFFSFYAILIFHLSYAFWARDLHDGVAVNHWATGLFEVYARLLVFSGFTVLFLSFFLFGLRPAGSNKRKYLWLVLLVFLAVWNFTAGEITDAWDIYPYLLAGIFTLLAARALKIPKKLIALFGLLLVSVPWWEFEGVWEMPADLEAALWGTCLSDGRADWPLLPWLGYPLLAFGAGAMVQARRAEFISLKKSELAAWLLLLAVSIPWLGGYYVTPLGGGFGCYVFRRPPLEFWAHQIWIWFLVRASLTDAVQSRLDRRRFVHWLSRRQVNRRFFLVYFLHYPLCLYAGNFAHFLNKAYWPWSYVIAFTVIALLLEGLPIVIGKIFVKISDRGRLWEKNSAR